eukprot:SM000043S15865  [mRNA]  locus=s43:685800:687216:+ [translate_table: standard]
MFTIRSPSGRPIKPVLNVEDHPVDWNYTAPWNIMVSNGMIRYIEPEEDLESKPAVLGYELDIKIHQCTKLGLAVSLIPFPEHSQSARNVFASSMIKQSLHISSVAEQTAETDEQPRRPTPQPRPIEQLDKRPIYDWNEKACTMLQRPLLSTMIGRKIGYTSDPNCVNLVTCIMSMTGYNQEDAIIVKKSRVQGFRLGRLGPSAFPKPSGLRGLGGKRAERERHGGKRGSGATASTPPTPPDRRRLQGTRSARRPAARSENHPVGDEFAALAMDVHGAFGSRLLDLIQRLARQAIDRRPGLPGAMPGFNAVGSLAQVLRMRLAVSLQRSLAHAVHTRAGRAMAAASGSWRSAFFPAASYSDLMLLTRGN